MSKFILKEDMVIKLPGIGKNFKLMDKGSVFEPNENNEYVIESAAGTSIRTYDQMINSKDEFGNSIFDMTESKIENDNIDITIEEINDNDDLVERRWRIQLDVKTSRFKLKQIEKFINESIRNMI